MPESWSRDLIETQHFALKCKHSHEKPDNCKSILRLYGDWDCTKHNLYCLWQCKCSQVVFTGIKLGKVVTLAIRIQKQLDNIRYDALYFFYFLECLTEDGPWGADETKRPEHSYNIYNVFKEQDQRKVSLGLGLLQL